MRVENWNIKFLEHLEAHQAQATAFDWDPTKEASCNCLTFSNSFVQVLTDKDYYGEMAAEFVYDSPLSALKVLKKLEVDSLDQLIGSIFPSKEMPYVIRGDLVMVPSTEPTDSPLHLLVAVADPPYYWTMSSAYGLARGNLGDAVKAYAVE